MQVVVRRVARPGAQATPVAAHDAQRRAAGAGRFHRRQQGNQRQRLVRQVIDRERHAHDDVEVLVDHASARGAALEVARHVLLQQAELVVVGERHAVALGPVGDFGSLVERRFLRVRRAGSAAPELAHRLSRHAENALRLLVLVLQDGAVARLQYVGDLVERHAAHEGIGGVGIAVVAVELEVTRLEGGVRAVGEIGQRVGQPAVPVQDESGERHHHSAVNVARVEQVDRVQSQAAERQPAAHVAQHAAQDHPVHHVAKGRMGSIAVAHRQPHHAQRDQRQQVLVLEVGGRGRQHEDAHRRQLALIDHARQRTQVCPCAGRPGQAWCAPARPSPAPCRGAPGRARPAARARAPRCRAPCGTAAAWCAPV